MKKGVIFIVLCIGILVLLPFVLVVAGLFISTFWSMIVYTKGFNQGWITSIVAILFSGMAVGFLMACLDYFSGR